MSWNCTHPECQEYTACQKPFTTSKVQTPVPETTRLQLKDWLETRSKGEKSPDPQPQQVDHDVIEKIPESADQDAALDTLVSRASIPNLGALIKQGIKQGLIAPTTSYR